MVTPVPGRVGERSKGSGGVRLRALRPARTAVTASATARIYAIRQVTLRKRTDKPRLRRQVVGLDGGEPGSEVAAAGAGGHHLGERGGVPGVGVDARAAGADVLPLGRFVRLEAVGASQEPPGDLAGSRHCGNRIRGGEGLSE